jgi:hypothetical protein
LKRGNLPVRVAHTFPPDNFLRRHPLSLASLTITRPYIGSSASQEKSVSGSMTNRSSEAGSTLTVLGSSRKSRFLGRDIERRIETDRVRWLCNTTGSKLAWEDRVRGRTVGLRGRRLGRKKSTSSLGGRSQVSRTCQIDVCARQSKASMSGRSALIIVSNFKLQVIMWGSAEFELCYG